MSEDDFKLPLNLFGGRCRFILIMSSYSRVDITLHVSFHLSLHFKFAQVQFNLAEIFTKDWDGRVSLTLG